MGALARGEGIPGQERLSGPHPVGRYAAALRTRLRGFARVQLSGEVVNLRPAGAARVYFELRDADGALPCAMWRNDWDRASAITGTLADGMHVIVAGGCDYYPGSASASPSFSFQVSELRIAGEGDLLAQIALRRRALAADGLLERQRALPRTLLPRSIGVVCAESGKARDDLIAALARRGWAGRVVWAFAPVQDRHAAGRIARALGDLAACGDVEAIVVARGGGSLVDLLAFSDEALCRTVALLAVPVIASIGHHTDRTLLDEVAAASASTPTHAAEAAVPLDCAAAAARLRADAELLAGGSRAALVRRARRLTELSRAPGVHLARHRRALRQTLAELRASSRRRLVAERMSVGASVEALARRRELARRECAVRRPADLERLRLALAAHDPARTLARGYALVENAAGEPVSTVAGARAAATVTLALSDGRVAARVLGEAPEGPAQ